MEEVFSILNYRFKNKDLLVAALTHPSYRKENPKDTTYERLEFFGDKVLGFIIAEHLYFKFTTESEGQISRRQAHAVCGDVCTKVAEKIDVAPYIRLSKAQEKDDGRRNKKILENVIEAIIGALYIDGGMDVAKDFVLKYWSGFIADLIHAPHDPKSALQEIVQKKFQQLPEYEIREMTGTNGGTIFESTVIVDGMQSIGYGKTRKASEKEAALKLLQLL